MMKTALFSGRFDPPNLGHVITVLRLLKDYDMVAIVPLNKDREGCDIDTCVRLFSLVFTLSCCMDKIIIKPNKTHFGKIKPIEIYELCDRINQNINKITYVGGNKLVNEHIKKLGIIKVQYIPRTILYNSTEIRNKMTQGESLEDQYNLSKE